MSNKQKNMKSFPELQRSSVHPTKMLPAHFHCFLISTNKLLVCLIALQQSLFIYQAATQAYTSGNM